MLLPDLDSGLIAEDSTLAPCQSNDPDLWFAESPRDIEQAKALCAGCPFRAECLRGALDRNEHAGVWGGQLLVAGEIVARKRGRGRPRKVA
ncbi:WhiB family transcriptional regulator [Spelaeicoccus albus]|uniref:Transcriptional regulator WhiB n=1 Tax=Spelaeicoccus albus TaxID=1280376 RepID=A0A7Z0II76_9MICO|nr:WhiB family transcriptional regulator [Spelaeicoccus albus]NYI68107.1 WhiB family redox-sensing transcriptional regulator [Spelaeicoccus albus]